jgi:TRAP-type C4-dicarboxylate transport system permease small subunit
MINVTTLTTGALGFTIALAWNNAVSDLIRSLFPAVNERAAALATLVYALLVTILVIVVVAAINHTRRLVHQYNCRNGKKHEAGPPPDEKPPNCDSCAKHCGGTSAIIRLWEPGAI